MYTTNWICYNHTDLKALTNSTTEVSNGVSAETSSKGILEFYLNLTL